MSGLNFAMLARPQSPWAYIAIWLVRNGSLVLVPNADWKASMSWMLYLSAYDLIQANASTFEAAVAVQVFVALSYILS